MVFFKEKRRVIINLSLIIISLLIGIITGIKLNRNYKINSITQTINDKLNIENIIRSFSAEPRTLEILVNQKNSKVIEDLRKTSIKEGLLVDSCKRYIKGKIVFQNNTIDSKIRLKGDFPDHWAGEKISFRIKLIGGDIFGVEKFSIQDPKTRNFAYEWVFQEMCKNEGLISLYYDFFEIYFNNEYKGIYAFEEFFDNKLLIKNNKKIGPILAFSEKLLFNNKSCLDCSDFLDYHKELFKICDIKSYDNKEYNNIKVNRQHLKDAIYKLDEFRKGNKPASEVFDVSKFGKYYAISDVTGGYHGLTWNNLRFYYDPHSKLMEPIPYDSNSGKLGEKSKKTCFTRFYKNNLSYRFNKLLFDDKIFLANYFSELNRITKKNYLENFFNDNYKKLDSKVDILCIDDYDNNYNVNEVLFERRDELYDFLNKQASLKGKFNITKSDSLVITLYNPSSLPIEIQNITFNNTNIDLKNYFIEPTRKDLHTKEITLSFPVKEREIKNNVFVSYSTVGLTNKTIIKLDKLTIKNNTFDNDIN